MKPILEYSEDRGRAGAPHIAQAIGRLHGLSGHRCVQCARSAAALVNMAVGRPFAVCDRHADEWRGLSPLERRSAVNAWSAR